MELPEDAEINFEGATDTAVTNLMICKRLDRIADALEDINGALISMAEILKHWENAHLKIALARAICELE